MRTRFSGRKPILTIGTIAATTLVLSACSETPPTEVVYSTVEQCIAAQVDPQVCNAGFNDAMQAHLINAPKFDGQAACEAEHGAGACVAAPPVPGQTASSGGGFFMPFMAGYLMSSALNNIGDYNRYRDQQSYGSTPIYRNSRGQNVSYGLPSRNSTVTSPGSSRPSVTAPSKPTVISAPVNRNTTTMSRSGFGGKSGGFGG